MFFLFGSIIVVYILARNLAIISQLYRACNEREGDFLRRQRVGLATWRQRISLWNPSLWMTSSSMDNRPRTEWRKRKAIWITGIIGPRPSWKDTSQGQIGSYTNTNGGPFHIPRAIWLVLTFSLHSKWEKSAYSEVTKRIPPSCLSIWLLGETSMVTMSYYVSSCAQWFGWWRTWWCYSIRHRGGRRLA